MTIGDKQLLNAGGANRKCFEWLMKELIAEAPRQPRFAEKK